MYRIVVLVRSFQGGACFDTFDTARFERGLQAPLQKLIDTAPTNLSNIIVISCGEPGSKYAEEVRSGKTVTMEHIERCMESHVQHGRVHTLCCAEWGLNAGSATALNMGVARARELGATHVLCWSPEIDLDGHMLTEMVNHMDAHALSLVGYARTRWYQRIQWMFAQNTCALWDIDTLTCVDGFNPECNGDGVCAVETLEYGRVPLAGMEDIEAYFRASARTNDFVRWGHVGMRHPVT